MFPVLGNNLSHAIQQCFPRYATMFPMLYNNFPRYATMFQQGYCGYIGPLPVIAPNEESIPDSQRAFLGDRAVSYHEYSLENPLQKAK